MWFLFGSMIITFAIWAGAQDIVEAIERTSK